MHLCTKSRHTSSPKLRRFRHRVVDAQVIPHAFCSRIACGVTRTTVFLLCVPLMVGCTIVCLLLPCVGALWVLGVFQVCCCLRTGRVVVTCSIALLTDWCVLYPPQPARTRCMCARDPLTHWRVRLSFTDTRLWKEVHVTPCHMPCVAMVFGLPRNLLVSAKHMQLDCRHTTAPTRRRRALFSHWSLT